MNKFKLEDLAVLQYAPNNCYIQVIDVQEAISKNENFKVDADNGIWNYEDWKNISIGKSRGIFDINSNRQKSGVIGLYDRTRTLHLSLMVQNAIEFLNDSYKTLED
jgi:hypothetical protein